MRQTLPFPFINLRLSSARILIGSSIIEEMCFIRISSGILPSRDKNIELDSCLQKGVLA